MLFLDIAISDCDRGTKMQLSDSVGHRLKLHDLRVLMAVVQAGSMRKAATLLNTTQSAISRSIADLEHTVGVSLLDRLPQGVEPTAYGRALLDCGVAVFDDLRQGVKNIEFLADPNAGEVRIGSIPPLAASFVSAVADRVSRRYPRIVLHIISTQTEALYPELNERNVDVLVTQRVGPLADEQLAFEKLYDDSYAVVAGAENPWARRRKIELAELVNELWALPPPTSALGAVFVEAFRASGLDYPRTAMFSIPADVRISLLATGRFLSIFSTSRLKFPAASPPFKVLPVELPVPPVPIGILTLKNRTLSPVTQLFIEHAREVAKPLARKW
jgi:DNA-binding transcriptional LysR family regulator